MDFDISGNFANNDSEDKINSALFEVNYKISKGKRKNIFKNGYILYGGEVLLDYLIDQVVDLDLSDPDEEVSFKQTDQTISASFGPFVGIEYKVTKRISIFTEAGFYLNVGYNIENNQYSSLPDQDFKNTNIFFKEQFFLPRSVILFYSF